jgi:hypothetical protein
MQSVENKHALEFLLGRLADDVRERLEERFVTDQQTFEELLQAENDLIDDYVARRLSSEDESRFEAVFLPRRKERVDFARALARYAATEAGLQHVAVLGWKNTFRQFLWSPRRFAIALTAGLFLAVATFIVTVNRGPEKNVAVTTPEPSLTVPEIPVISNPPPPPPPGVNPVPTLTPVTAPKDVRPQKSPMPAPRSVIATITLTPGLTRGSGTAASVELPATDGVVKLSLPPEHGNFRRYAVIVETVDGRQVWQQTVRSTSGNISTNIPRKRLLRGDYIITLKGIAPDGVADVLNEYTFTVKN